MSKYLGDNQLAAHRELWKVAERCVKRSEVLRSELVMAAVNELRYCGYHFVQAYTATSQEEAAEQLAKSNRHCQRAIYDASEAELLLRLERFAVFQQDYATIEIVTPVLDYPNALEAHRTAQKILMRRDSGPKEDLHTEAVAACDKLEQFEGPLQDARLELNKRLSVQREERERKERERQEQALERTRTHSRWLVTTVVAGIVMLVAVLKYVGGDQKADGDHPARPPVATSTH